MRRSTDYGLKSLVEVRCQDDEVAAVIDDGRDSESPDEESR